MPKKLNNKIIDERLVKKNIKRVGNYINYNTKIEFKCIICDYVWKTTPCLVLNNHGCPDCIGHAKLTNERIDKKLENTKIKRVEDCINNNTKINFQCLECNFIWKTQPSSILNDVSSCPICNSPRKLTNEIVDKKLESRNIKRLSDCYSYYDRVEFECTIENCGYKWMAIVGILINTNSKCKKCIGLHTLTNADVDEKLRGKNIKRLDNYINSKTSINFQCLICNHIWSSRLWSILTQERDCPKCVGCSKLTNEIVDERLKGKNIKRIGNYINIHTLIDFQCLSCQNIWPTIPKNILNNHGCPKCKSSLGELMIEEFLNKNNIIFVQQYKIKLPINKRYSRCDFYLPEKNIIIEYNGIQHYEPTCFKQNPTEEEIQIVNDKFKRQKIRDEQLREYCKESNINLLEIDGRTYKNDILMEFLKEYFK